MHIADLRFLDQGFVIFYLILMELLYQYNQLRLCKDGRHLLLISITSSGATISKTNYSFHKKNCCYKELVYIEVNKALPRYTFK